MTVSGRRELAFVIVALLLSLYAVNYRIVACDPAAPAAENSPEMLVSGLGVTPYQYRVLVPWLVRAALEVRLLDPSHELAAFVVIETLSWLLMAFAFRRFLRGFIDDPALSNVAALSVYAILPFNYFGQVYFPYDVPSVLLFTVGLTALHERRWGWFFVVFGVATLNRETSIFLTATSVLVLLGRSPLQKVIRLVSLQVIVWLSLKTILWIAYRENRLTGHGLFDFQLMVNLATILETPVKVIGAMATWGGIWIAVAAWYVRLRDRFLRRALWSVPIMVAAMFIVGFVTEVRIYGEAIPVLLAAFWVGLFDAWFEYVTGRSSIAPEAAWRTTALS